MTSRRLENTHVVSHSLINAKGTCTVEGGHVEHGFLVSLFNFLLRDDQLDLIPFIRLQENKLHTYRQL